MTIDALAPLPDHVRPWAEKVYGTEVDFDGVYGAQGPDLVNAYAHEVYGMPYSRGNGIDKAANMAHDYAKHGWTPHVPAAQSEPGDIGSMRTDTEYGQCFITVQDHGDELDVLYQNPGPVAVHRIPKDAVVCYARPARNYGHECVQVARSYAATVQVDALNHMGGH